MRNTRIRGRVSGRTLTALALLLSTLTLPACGALGVKPWDHDLLAQRAMQLNTHPHITACHEHIYFSKEGSSGGRTFDGGGCGCN